MKKYILGALAVFIGCWLHAQKQNYKVAVIAFYNLENFYDTVHNPMVNDVEFTPQGAKNYNSKIYFTKIERLATVLSGIGTDAAPANPDGPALIGVAEIENDTVLNDLIHHPLLIKRNYKFVHYDSRDARGVDVALLYNPKYFKVEESKPLFVKLPGNSKDAYYTRDVLWVKGKLDGETIHVYVNHWPSRLGGEERSAPARAAAAMVCKKHMDSIAKADGEQKVIIMGDLNDDPISPSITEVLKAKGKIADVQPGGIFNPWIDLYKKGIGTLAYQDAWGLFDQIMINYPWLNKSQNGFFYYQQFIYNREFMKENIGKYKGYPMRTWDGNTYRGGYSDHFPTYIVLLKRIE
ncbi:MAG: endonuclease/exonuclease/phosphatase [Bacteroidetes bacterium]|nr:endonuclease/exonuclease/phosphatase [Bacteroidota bacterium]MBS1670656.1 endonuclease/exonuclease/phosphatase [Bacteroidota bacterium]